MIDPTPTAEWQPWDDLTPTQRRRRADTAGTATLTGGPVSKAAEAMIDDLLENTVIPAKSAGSANRTVRPSSRDKLRTALGAFVCDLLLAAAKGRAVKLSTREEAFTGKAVNWTAFSDVRKALTAAALLEHIPGYQSLLEVRTRPVFCATPMLIATAQRHGVGLATVGKDFRVTPPLPLVADASLHMEP